MEKKLITTSDGSHTLYQPGIDEHYHSTHGALHESRHVFIGKGLNHLDKNIEPVNVLEVGFGTGLNALLTLIESEKDKRKIHYIGVEPYPLEEHFFKKLNYGKLIEYDKAGNYLQQMHEKDWNFPFYITEYFILNKLRTKFEEATLQPSMFHLIYYDAFAPDKQDELWNKKNFEKCYTALKEGGVLVTYSSKGQVKRDLAQAGFNVSKVEGPEGKREMLRAIKR